MFTAENISDGESSEIVRTKNLDYMSQLILYRLRPGSLTNFIDYIFGIVIHGSVCGACTHWLSLISRQPQRFLVMNLGFFHMVHIVFSRSNRSYYMDVLVFNAEPLTSMVKQGNINDL